jgi:beta-N-acetylhexosaminidase
MLATALTAAVAVAPGGAAAESDATPTPRTASVVASGLLRHMSLEDKVGQLFVTWVHGRSADEVHPGNQRDFGVDTAADVVRKFHPGGVVYFNNSTRDNVETPRQIAALSNGLQRAALGAGSRVPLIVSTDQEMGIVTRIGPPATQFPGNMALGAGRSTADAQRAAAITGRELRAMGINQDFAPDADVNSNPENPVIGVRSYSSDPALAAEFVAAQVRGYETGLPTRTVSAAAKHFPGHGDTRSDSHTELPEVDRSVEQWRELDAPPFRAAIAAGIDSIMTAHIQMPRIDPSGNPATLSEPVVTGLLREELGYDGVVVTDALEMEGVRKLHSDAEIPVLALKAGVDQLLMPVDLELAITSVVNAVRSGELTEERVDQSVLRILRMKLLRGVLAAPLVDERAVDRVVGTPANLAAAKEITDRTVTVVRNDPGTAPFATRPGSVLVTGWGETTGAALAAELTASGSAATPLMTGTAPTDEQIAAAVAAAGPADAVVVLTSNLYQRPAQQKLVDALVAAGERVVAVAVQNPYDVAHTSAPTWLATYSYSPVVVGSLVDVLFGDVTPGGTLPVDVPGPTPYPFGHGLSW